ncbi:hypothetical protein, partial [Bradyrhizobium sp. SZCCHNR1085]|uniref:hypothetical protein n=1 Tax=unclassified Bradyrhizobium TaxID=2631580 RepID=UPI0039675A48
MQLAAQLADVGRGFRIRHHIGHQPLAGAILAYDSCSLRHAGLRQQRRLDLAELDAEATQLHLAIQPPQELQLAIGAPAHQVSGAVQPLAGRERVRQEALRRQPRPPQIAA